LVKGSNMILVGHVEHDRGESRIFGTQARPVGFGADARDNIPAARSEVGGDGLPDAPRGSGDEN
jgi:hypothetical protein